MTEQEIDKSDVSWIATVTMWIFIAVFILMISVIWNYKNELMSSPCKVCEEKNDVKCTKMEYEDAFGTIEYTKEQEVENEPIKS